MEKIKSKISLVAMMLLWSVVILAGCGNPYKNMRLTLDSTIAVENEQYTYDIDLNNGQSTSFSFDVRVEGAKKKVSTDVFVSSTQTEIVSIKETSKEGNTTHISMNAHRVGQSVITIKSAEGNLTKSVIVRVHVPLDDMQVKREQIYVERGALVDAREFFSFEPSNSDRTDLILSLFKENEMIQQAVALNGNTFCVANDSAVEAFTLSVSSLHNENIEMKELYVQVIDVVQPNEIVPKYLKGNDYIELTKSQNGNYQLFMAQNSSDVEEFTRNLYFFVRKEDKESGLFQDILLDQTIYQLGVLDAFGTLKDTFSNAFVDITKMDNYFTIMELTMGSTSVTFGYNHLQLTNQFIKKIEIDIQVQYYPENIIVTNNGVQLNQEKPMIIYDDDRVNGVNNAIQASVFTVGNNILARSPFYIRIVGDQREDYKVTLSNRYGEINQSVPYTAQDGPFYVTHNYPVEETIGEFALEFESAVAGVSVKTTVPLEFVRGQMNINTDKDVYYLNVDGEDVVGGKVNHILLTGIQSSQVWDRIQIIGMKEDLVTFEWLEDHSGLAVRANEEGLTGRFHVRLVAPNGNVKVITIVVFHELQSAGVYVGNVVSTNFPIVGVDVTQGGNVSEQDIPVYKFLVGSTIPLNYVLNGQIVNEFFDGITLVPTVSSRGVTISNDRKQLIIGNSSTITTVELLLSGYDSLGQTGSTKKRIVFRVQPVLPIIEVNMAKADGSTSYTIYSSSHLSTLPDDTYKKATVRYRVYPANATYNMPIWNVYGQQGEHILSLTYNRDDISSHNLRIEYTATTKLYTYTYYGSRISFLLYFDDVSVVEVTASLSEFDLLTVRMGVSLTQEYHDINHNKTLLTSDEASVTIQVLKPTKVSAIRFENLDKENAEYVYHFDIRNMTQSGQIFTSGNEASIRTLVYPYNAINTNVSIQTVLYTSRDNGQNYTTTGETGASYLNYEIISTKGKEYEKEVKISLLRPLNEGNISRYIEVIVRAEDSSAGQGAGYTVTNRFRVYLLDGSEATPFRIRSASDIDDIRKGLSSHYLLLNDIDLSSYIASRMGGSWQPIGSSDQPFTGSLASFITEERQTKYSISGLTLLENTNTTSSLTKSVVEEHTKYYAGLFGYVGSGARIQNVDVILDKIDIRQNKGVSGDSLYVGVLAGYVQSGATIAGVGIFDNNGATETVVRNGISFVSISPITAYIGGMIGYNEGEVKTYTFTLGNDNQISYIAGNSVNLVMALSDEIMTGANTTLIVGGLSGYNSGTISTSHASENVLGLESFDVVVDINPSITYNVEHPQYALVNASSVVGGLVGTNAGSILGFDVKSKISGLDCIGGLVGKMQGGKVSETTVAPVLRGRNHIGGVIGTYVGASTLDDIHVEFYETNYQESIQNSSIIGSTYVGGIIGYSLVGNDNEIENISIYSYSKREVEAYSPTANTAFFGDIVATGDNAYVSTGIGRWNTANNLTVQYNNWFVFASIQAVKAGATLSGLVSSALPKESVKADAIALMITTPNEITDKETFAFGGETSTNSYAIVNKTWVGTSYDDIMSVTYQFSEGNEQTGFNDNDYTGVAYKDALFYTYPAYKVVIDGEDKVYPINLAGNKSEDDQKVKLLVNLPPISVQCEKIVPYVSMIRLADHAYDGSGNIIGDTSGSIKEELDKVNRISVRDIVKASAIPAFLSKARTTLSSSNPNVAEVVTVGNETYLQLKGIGEVDITITSLYDSSLTATTTIHVVDKILEFGLYEDDAYENVIVNKKQVSNNTSNATLDLEKGSTKAIYSNISRLWEEKLTQFDTSHIGVRYRVTSMTEEDETGENVTTTDQEMLSEYLSLNGVQGTAWDTKLGQVTLKGLKAGNLTMTACPYYIIDDEKVLVEDYEISFDISIRNGTQSIYLDSQSTHIVFEPSNTTQRFVVNVVTDKQNEQLVLQLTDNNAKTYTFLLDTAEFGETWSNKTIQLGTIDLSVEQYSKNNDLMTFVFHVSANLDQMINDREDIDEIEVKEIISAPITFDVSFYVLEHGQELELEKSSITADNNYAVTGQGLYIVKDNQQTVLDKIKQSITSYPNINITMTTQELQEGALTFYHYPNNLETKGEDDQFVFNGEEVPYDNILSGIPGLLKIDYLPAFSNIAYLEISSTEVGGEYIRFDQMLKTYKKNNDNTYNITYIRDMLNTDQTDGRVKLTKRSVDQNGDVFFNGEYYVRTLIPSFILAGSTYTITVDAYRYKEDGSVEKVLSYAKDLMVLTPPSVEIRSNAVAIARGTTQDFTLKINGLDDTTSLSFEDSTLIKGNVNYSIGNYFTITSNGEDAYQAWVSSTVPSGAQLDIVYTVSKRINGTMITETNKDRPLTFMVSDFVVNAIGVDRVYNSRFVGELNQFYELKIKLSDVSYNPNLLGVRSAIDGLEEHLSRLVTTKDENNIQSSTWWVKEGISYTQIRTNRYAGFDASFVVKEAEGIAKIKNTVITTNALLQAKVYITYDTDGIKALAYDEILGQSVQEFTYEFGFNCYRYTDESNPTPIYNENQFIEMMDNGVGDYRLMSDITLTNWTPRDSYHTTSDATSGSSVTGVISSLDGNGYVIEIKSFDHEAIAQNGIAGLFATVHEDTILKNLVVLLAPTIANEGDETIEKDKEGSGPLSSVQSTDKFDITVDMTGATSAIFGTIAGVNNGMITNCSVAYNTEAYQDKRINEMLGDSANQVEDKQDILSFEEYKLYNNNNSGENLKVKDEYRFYQEVKGKNNFHRSIYDSKVENGITTAKGRSLTSIFIRTDLGVSAYVGGLVGQNNGFVTNSHVEHISIKGSGYVAGLVAENTNKISSSYYFDGNIKNNFNSEENNSGTAGLVALNSGTIAYSYVEGRNSVATVAQTGRNALNDSITSISLENFTGYNYENISYTGNLAQSMRSTASAINTNTHAGGFVYSNSGTITNSYANILVNSTANSAGFVYENKANGQIREVYSLSSVRINQRNASQFSGRTSSGSYLNQGSIEHSVYLKVENMAATIINEEEKSEQTIINDNVTDDIFADYISMTQFGRYSSFTGYAFNQDYHANSKGEVAKAVWFIPEIGDYNKQEGGTSLYFDIMNRQYYLPGRPQLVSANLETRSSYYCAGSTEDAQGNTKYQYQHMAADEGSETNPYLVYDATLLDNRMNDIQNNRNELAKLDSSTQSKYPEPYNIRLIRDFSYSDKPDHKATTYNVTFSGILDGNGMEVQDLIVTASKNSDQSDAPTIVKAGWFGSIEDGTVKNLNIEVMEVSATGVPFVGVLSGVIYNSNIYNVTINPKSSNAFISGANVLGGLSGLVYGQSQLVGITSNISITSYFKSGSNLFNFENTQKPSGDFAILQVDESKVTIGTDPTGLTATEAMKKYINYNKVSYVGGIVGIMDADKSKEIDEDSVAVAQTSQARRLTIGDNVRLAGEIVGGIMGYMGSNVVSVNDEIRLGTSASLSIIASRVAGGIIGENHGTLQRSFVAHDIATQETIDQAQKLGVYSDLNYRNLFGTPLDGSGTSRNAHFIGGLVGLNMGGAIENSYNKVTVYSPNSRAAGGLIGLNFGSQIRTSYTTASVGAYSTAGGLVGREGSITLNETNNNIESTELNRIKSQYYMRLDTSYYARESMAKQAEYDGAVAASVFSESDLKLMLRPNGELSPYYSLGAFVGQIDKVKFEDTTKFTSYNFERMKKEVNFALKKQITYKSEIGMDQSMFIPEYNSSDTSVPLITGGVYEVNQTDNKTEYYLYRDLGYYASLRTQEEFVARRMLWDNDYRTWENKIFQNNEGKNAPQLDKTVYQNTTDTSRNQNKTYYTLNVTTGEYIKDEGADFKENVTYYEQATIKVDDLVVVDNAFSHLDNLRANTRSIYNTYLEMYWNGYNINQNLEVIDEAYVYPDLRAEVYDTIVYVYTVDDLKKMDVYPDATFILMNDIDLGKEAWTPLAQNKAFTGTLTSNTGYTYTIKNLYFTKDSLGLNENPNNTYVGLIAKAKRATFTNFNLTLKANDGDKDSTVLLDAPDVAQGYGLDFGNLVGYVEGNTSKVTTFTDITISSQPKEDMATSATLNLKNINTYGGVVGAGNNMAFTSVKVKDIHTNVQSLVGSGTTRSHGLGGLLGVARQELLPVEVKYYEPLQVTNCSVDGQHILLGASDVDTLRYNHSTISMGGAIGDLDGQERTSNSRKFMLDVSVTNVILTENVKSTSIGLDFAMGGVIGRLTGNTINLSSENSTIIFDNKIDGWTTANNITLASLMETDNIAIGGWIGYQATNNSEDGSSNLSYVLDNYSPTISITAGKGNVGGLFGKLIGVSLTSAVENKKATIDANNVAVNVTGAIASYGTLAGSMENTSSISNLKVSNYLNNSSCSGNNAVIGGLVGTTNGVSITACEVEDHTTNTISATVHGGVVGQATIGDGNNWENIAVTTDTLNGDIAGGLVGWLTNHGTISNIQINTNIHGDNIGGLSGIVRGNGTISKVITKGQLTNTGEEVGGLIGANDGNTIEQCIAEMNITTGSSTQKVGGLVGINNGDINNSYSQGYIDISNAAASNLTGFGGLVGVNTGLLSRNYTISRYVYGGNVQAYYNIDKGGFVGTNNGTIETNNWYVSDITPYSNKLGTSLYMDELLGITLHELVGETTPTGSDTWWIHKNDNDEFVENKTPQLRWAKDLTTKIIETSNSDSISNILYTSAVTAQEVTNTGLVVLKEDEIKSVTLNGSNNGVIFGGKTGGNDLAITGNNNSVIDYFRVQSEGYLIGEENDGLLNRVSYIGNQANFMAGSNDGEVRDSQLLTTANLSNYNNSINTIYAKQELDADAGWGDTNGDTIDLIMYNHEGKRSTRGSLVLPTQFKIIQSHSPSDYTTLDFDDTWIIIRTSNKKVEDDDITRRTLNYGYPVLRWTLQDNYRVAGNGLLSNQYYWTNSNNEYNNIVNDEINNSGYDIDLGNKLWTPVDGTNKFLTGFLQNIKDSEIDTTSIVDTFGNTYTSDRGQTLNRIYNMTVYNNTLDNVGLFQTLGSVSNIRMENALVYNTKAGANVGTIAGTLSNGTKTASVNNAIVAKSATNVGAIAGVANSVTYAYNIYTTGGRSLEGENKEYSYTNGIAGGRITGQIVGNGNVNQAYTPLQNENITGNGTVTSCFNGDSNLTTDFLEGFNWQVWTRINGAKHYNSLPYIDGNIPFWIDGVQHVERSGYYYNGVSTGIREGAASSTIEVLTPQQLAVVAYMVNVEGKNVSVKLMDDIDLSSNIWTPMGTATRPYLGTFNGNGHTISGLTLSRVHDIHDDQDNAGLFGVTTNATISNLTIENAQITFTDNNAGKTVSHVGALVGNASGGTIRDIAINNVNIYTNGKIVGSVIGTMNNTSVTNVGATTAHLYGNTMVGGIIGSSTNGTLETSFVQQSTLGQVVASIMPNASVESEPTQGGLIATATNTNVLEVVANTVDITNQSNSLTYVGSLFGKVTYTEKTTSMTTGIHNLYAYKTTFNGNNVGQLYSQATGFDDNNNVTMLYTNETMDTSKDLRTGGVPIRGIVQSILSNNPWWSNLLEANSADIKSGDLRSLVQRPYYVPSDNSTETNIGLGNLLATLSMRYYGENIPASNYTLTGTTGEDSIYYSKANDRITKTAGTEYYPIKGLTLTAQDRYSINDENIDAIFNKVSSSTFEDLEFQLSCSFIKEATNVGMKTINIEQLSKPLIMTVQSGDYSNLTLSNYNRDTSLKGGVFAQTINGGTFTDFTINASNVTGGGFAENITGGTLKGITVTADNVQGAGIAASMTGGSIVNSSVSGAITDGYSVTIGKVAGGLLGYSTIAIGEGNSCSATLNLKDKADYVGGIVGYYAPTTTDENIATYSGASLSNGTYVGGVYGYASQAIKGGKVTSNITIANAGHAGAIVGYVNGSIATATLPSSISLNTVVNAGAIAGECGTIISYTLVNNANITITGLASATNSSIGGLVGVLNGTLNKNRTYTGTIQGSGYVGGVAGKVSGTISNLSTQNGLTVLNNSSNVVDANNSALGGIVGQLISGSISEVTNNATIKTSYTLAGTVTYQARYNIGGIVGKMINGSITKATNNTEIIAEESTNVGGIVGYVGNFSSFYDNNVNDRVIGGEFVGGLAGYHSVPSGDNRRVSERYKNNNLFGSKVEVHSQSGVGLYVGNEDDDDFKHDNNQYYYVIFEGWDGTSEAYEKPLKFDYAVIKSTQYAYYMHSNGESGLTDKNELANYTYKNLDDANNRGNYWGYFNFCRVDTTAWRNHAYDSNNSTYRHVLHLKKYSIGTANFYGTDNGYYRPPTDGIYDGSDNRFSSFYSGAEYEETESIEKNQSDSISISMIASVTYTWDMLEKYSNSQGGNAGNMSNAGRKALSDNNALQVYSESESYTHYDFVNGMTMSPSTKSYQYLGVREVFGYGLNNNLYGIYDEYGDYEGSEAFTVAINSMGNLNEVTNKYRLIKTSSISLLALDSEIQTGRSYSYLWVAEDLKVPVFNKYEGSAQSLKDVQELFNREYNTNSTGNEGRCSDGFVMANQSTSFKLSGGIGNWRIYVFEATPTKDGKPKATKLKNINNVGDNLFGGFDEPSIASLGDERIGDVYERVKGYCIDYLKGNIQQTFVPFIQFMGAGMNSYRATQVFSSNDFIVSSEVDE